MASYEWGQGQKGGDVKVGYAPRKPNVADRLGITTGILAFGKKAAEDYTRKKTLEDAITLQNVKDAADMARTKLTMEKYSGMYSTEKQQMASAASILASGLVQPGTPEYDALMKIVMGGQSAPADPTQVTRNKFLQGDPPSIAQLAGMPVAQRKAFYQQAGFSQQESSVIEEHIRKSPKGVPGGNVVNQVTPPPAPVPQAQGTAQTPNAQTLAAIMSNPNRGIWGKFADWMNMPTQQQPSQLPPRPDYNAATAQLWKGVPIIGGMMQQEEQK